VFRTDRVITEMGRLGEGRIEHPGCPLIEAFKHGRLHGTVAACFRGGDVNREQLQAAGIGHRLE
jgi:hypothetical protein